MRAVAKKFGVSLCTVQRWVARGKGKKLDRLDLCDRPSGCRVSASRTDSAVEQLVISTRLDLKNSSDLGEFGAAAVHDKLVQLGVDPVPSVRTINRIFQRHGALDAARRVRRMPPPSGWYLPDLANRRVELDSFDIVEGLVIARTVNTPPLDVEVFNVVSLFGKRVNSWPGGVITAKIAAECAVKHWRAFGLRAYAQFDNDMVFQGPQQWPDTFGHVTRTCLSLGVVPVFAPPRETGFQAAIENYNGRWQAKVWRRFWHESLQNLIDRSNRFVAAARVRSAAAIEAAPPRRPFPTDWLPSVVRRKPLAGRVVFLRRSDASGRVAVLGRTFDVDGSWPGRLVRADVDLDRHQIRFHALRRRDPSDHRLLQKIDYKPSSREYRG